MLDQLAPHLRPHRLRELAAKIRRRGDQAVPAEWEIAVGYALSKVGAIVDPGDDKPGNPDFIFVPRDSNTELLIEVTAVSDKAVDIQNPVADFSEKLARIAVKQGISPQLGALSWRVGDVEVDQEVVLGLPKRGEIDAFFKSRDFRSFLSGVKATPTERRVFRFVARGVESVIVFEPDKQFSGGGHRAYKAIRQTDDNTLFNALKRKKQQLSGFGSNCPGIIFVCDNDSHLLKHSQMYSPGTYRLEDVVHAFFNDPAHRSSHRVHAVITLTVEEALNIWADPRRILRGRILPATHSSEFVRSEEFRALLNEAISTLPRPVATPINAKREYPLPFGFGGGSMADTKVTLSLLTLQKLLAGKLSYERFAEAHGELAVHLRRLDSAGRMISNIEIAQEQDQDDDWVTLKFEKLSPERLFDRRR